MDPRELRSQVYVIARPMLLSDALNLFYDSMTGALSKSTVMWYKRRLPFLLAHLGDVAIDSIRLDQLRNWRACLANRTQRYVNHPTRKPIDGGLSLYTLHQYVRAAKTFFLWLTTEGYLMSNPAERLELPKLPKRKARGITEENRDKMLAAARHPRDLAMLLVLADTGCRVGGLVKLQLDDLDLEQGIATVHEKGPGDGNERDVYLLPATVKAIKNWLTIRRAPTSCRAVFTSLRLGKQGGRSLTTGGAYEVLKRVAKDAGVHGRYNPHSWRHGAIRGMLDNGMPLPDVSQLAGHSSVKVTGDIYGVQSERALKRKHDKCSWLSGTKYGIQKTPNEGAESGAD